MHLAPSEFFEELGVIKGATKPIPRCPPCCARPVPRWSLLSSYLVMTALSDCKSPYSMEAPDPSKRGRRGPR
jgi:hypothetical protein